MIRWLATFALALGCLWVWHAQSHAYTSIRIPSSSNPASVGLPVRWNLSSSRNNVANGRVLYRIQRDGCSDRPGFIGPIDEFQAIQNSFGVWRGIPQSKLDFEFVGDTDKRTDANDDVNVLHFTSTGVTTGVFAVTVTTFDTVTGEILDADMEINDRDFTWDTLGPTATTGIVGRAMIENVVTHEIGHFVGLDHTASSESSMFFASGPGIINQVTLTDDDRALIIEDYPRSSYPTTATGTVRGTIDDGSNGRFGVEVRLIEMGSGRNVIGHITEDANQGFLTGEYEIVGVPPGTYLLLALPADPQLLGNYYNSAFTNFFPQVRGVNIATVGTPTLVHVGAGATVTGADITLTTGGQNPFEPNDNTANATTIASGEVATSVISPPSDQDYYSFTTTSPNQQVTIRVLADSFGSTLNPTLTLYDTNGTSVLASPDFGPNFLSSANDIDDTAFDADGVNFDSEINITMASAGTYYFKVASKVAASAGEYLVSFETVGDDVTSDIGHSSIETDSVSVPADGTTTFTLSVNARNLFGRDLNSQSFSVDLLDVSGGSAVVLQSSTATSPVSFTVTASSSPETVEYSARIDGVQILDTVEVSHFGTLSTANSQLFSDHTSLTANGYDRTRVLVDLRDTANNRIADAGTTVTVDTTLGTLDNTTSTGTNLAATFDPTTGYYVLDLVSGTMTGTCTLSANVGANSVGTTQVPFLGVAESSGSSPSSGSSKKDDGGGGCAINRSGAAIWALLGLLCVVAGCRRVKFKKIL